MVVLFFFIIIIIITTTTLFTPPAPHIPWTCTRVKDLSSILHVGHSSPLNRAINCLYIYFFFFFFSSWAGVHSVCVCLCVLFCLDFLFSSSSSLFLFIITITNFLELAVFPSLCHPPPPPLHHVLEIKGKKKKKQGFFFPSFWVLLIELAKEKKMWNAIDLAASWVPRGFYLSIVMLKQNELKPLLNLPQSSLHQPSGCDLWVLALWCQIWKFSLPLNNKQTKTQKQTYSHLMHYDACYFVLATMNYNSFKDIMEKRHYINKRSLHAGHVWYNYFFPFFSPQFGLEMDFWRLSAWHPYFWFTASWLFWVPNNNRKSTTPEPSSLDSLLLLLTALSYNELQPPVVHALKAFLVKDSRMGYKFIWQIL